MPPKSMLILLFITSPFWITGLLLGIIIATFCAGALAAWSIIEYISKAKNNMLTSDKTPV